MKKLFVMVILAVMSTGLFALDLGNVKGTWTDKTWDAEWTFSADGHIILTLASTGEVVYDFNDSTIQNFKVSAGTKGVTITFDCKDTERSYSFTKGVSKLFIGTSIAFKNTVYRRIERMNASPAQ